MIKYYISRWQALRISGLFLSVLFLASGALATELIVDDNLEDDPANHTWNTIQEGIDNANESDTIYVRNGTYKENIVIYKPLTLIGENNNNTIIDGENKGDVVYIKANNVQISGLKIINGRSQGTTYEVEIHGSVATAGAASWTNSTFAGLFFDIDENLGTETLSISTSGSEGRTIAGNDLTYSTSGQQNMLKVVDAKYNGNGVDAAAAGLEGFAAGNMAAGSGNYTIIGWMGEKYVAIRGKPNKLSELLIEQGSSPSEKKILAAGQTWELGGGYTLTVKSIDAGASPIQVWFTLNKDGVKKDDKVVTAGTTDSDPIYTYVEKSLCGETDVPVFVTYVDSVFTGAGTDMVQFRYTWLISPYCTEVKTGDVFGSLKVVSTIPALMLNNSDTTITLSRDSTVDIMGGIKLRVADSPTLRYYPFVEKFKEGTYEIRGSVATGNSSWNNVSFAGFFYDIDNNLGTETLNVTASGLDNRTIGENNLTYSTSGQEKMLNVVEAKYGCCGWDAAAAGLEKFGAGDMATHAGNFTIIGWQGERYVAIRGKPNKLSKLLIEHGSSSAEKKTLTVNGTWDIGTGFTLTATSIDAKSSPRQVLVTIRKDGVKQDEKLLTAGTNSTPVYTYLEKSLGGETDVPVFVTYLDSVFAGATTDMAQFRYTWFISEDVKEIKSGNEFGKLKVVSSTQENLVLKNNYPISLDRGSIVNLFGDIKFKVADSPELRYYPALMRTIKSFDGASGLALASGVNLDSSDNNIISDLNILNSTIGVRLNSAINNHLDKNNISSVTGIYLADSFHNLFFNNTLLSGGYGIRYGGYDRIYFNNSIDTSNELNGKPVYYYFNKSNIALDGIDTNHLTIAYSTGLKIRNSTVGGDGINLYNSESNTISNNSFGNETRSFNTVPVPPPIGGGGSGGGGGGMETKINLYHSNYNTMASNTLLSILLDYSDGNIVTNNSASITLYNSNNNVIDNNNASNKIRGIYLLSSSNNSLVQNIVWNNLDSGISLYASYNNTLNENSATNNNWNGISLSSSSNNTLINNSASNNKYNGIELQNSNNNTLAGNSMEGSTYNLVVAGDGVSSYIQKIDTSNIVDGKPVYYLVNQEDQIIDLTGNAGYVGIINSTNITVKDLTLKNNSAGILFINVNNSKIENVTLSNNSGGIYLYHSYDNSISNSRASYNYGGIALRFSDHNTFSNNSIFKNGRGISLDSSSNNTIKENYLFYNSEGILIYWCYWCWNNEYPSSNNLIFHNNFMNNTQNAIDYSYGDINLWNAAYPSGGNYWSDYTGEDLKSGVNRDQPGSDGIGDTPYYISGSIGAQDRYPFMQLNGWLLKDLIPTISFDKTKVDLSPQFTGTLNLTLDSAPAGLSGYNLTISLSNTSVATILSADFPGWATLRSNSSLPGGSVWIKAADVNELIAGGANNVPLATLTIRGDAPGNANLLVSVSSMDDDNGTKINPAAVASQIEVSAVVPFPCDVCKVPTDPDVDGIYEDINGNGRIDFNDVVVFFNYLEWVAGNQPIFNFDFNGNGRIDFNDIIKLFEEL